MLQGEGSGASRPPHALEHLASPGCILAPGHQQLAGPRAEVSVPMGMRPVDCRGVAPFVEFLLDRLEGGARGSVHHHESGPLREGVGGQKSLAAPRHGSFRVPTQRASHPDLPDRCGALGGPALLQVAVPLLPPRVAHGCGGVRCGRSESGP